MTALDPERKIADLSAKEFSGLIFGLLEHYDEIRAAQGGKLGNLSIKDFENLMQQIQEGKLYKHALNEQQITQRIFKDTEGLAVAGTPFRVGSVKEAEELFNWMSKYFTEFAGKVMVVVVASMDEKTGYSSIPR